MYPPRKTFIVARNKEIATNQTKGTEKKIKTYKKKHREQIKQSKADKWKPDEQI